MNILNKIKEITQAADALIDNNVTNQEERGHLKNEFSKLMTDLEQTYEAHYTQRYLSDNQDGNWLSKSARPVTVILMVCAWIAILFVPIPSEKWDYVMKFVTISGALVGSYFGLREIGKGIRTPIRDYTRSLRRKGH